MLLVGWPGVDEDAKAGEIKPLNGADAYAEDADAPDMPEADGGMLDRWLGVHRNSIEQEPYIIALALGYKAVIDKGDHSAWAAVIIYVLVACRYVHMFSYLLSLQPYRTLSFVTALWGSGFMAVLMLLDYTF